MTSTPQAWLRQLAAEYGVPLGDLLALARQNDPFNCGTPGDLAAARWFLAVWEEHGRPGVHLRRLHYVLASIGDVETHNGETYENTEGCWRHLQDAAKKARYLGLVHPGDFVDRRNPDPRLLAPAPAEPVAPAAVMDGEDCDVSIPTLAPALDVHVWFPSVTATGYEYTPGDQPYHLEIWVEKAGDLDDVLVPLCQTHRANLVAASGFQSVTGAYHTIQRIRRCFELGRPARIFYLSDFDPAGAHMPVAVARQLQFWLWSEGLRGDLKLARLAVTRDQIEEYDLPRVPIKDEDRRKAKFEAKHGEGAVELDALEAMRPGALARIVRHAIRPYRDDSLDLRMAEARAEAEAIAEAAWEDETGTIREKIRELAEQANAVLAEFQPELDRLRDAMEERLAPLRARAREMAERAQQETEEAAERLADAVNLPPRPVAEIDPPDEHDWLFDSERSFVEQMEHFRR